MTTHELKTWQPNFGFIESGQFLIDPRLADREFAVGDTVVFKEFDPARNDFTGKQASVVLAKVDKYNPFDFYSEEQIKQHGLNLIGLSRKEEAVLIPSEGALTFKAWPALFASLANRRVDVRLADREVRHGSAIVFMEWNPVSKSYTGQHFIRSVRRVTHYEPAKYYALAKVREKGLAVLGWNRQ